ncbi:ATP-binding protein [Streptomyces sp. NPDC055025]
MKQSAVKTLGVAALGAAFAATAVGTAAAAPVPVGSGALVGAGAVSALDTVGNAAEQLPLEEVAEELPAPTSDVVEGSRIALGTLRAVTPYVFGAAQTANPLKGLLGGLPVNGLAQGGLPVNGIPIGG